MYHLGDKSFSPTDIDANDSLESAIFLMVLLVVFVPVGTIVTPLSTLVLVGFSGGIYSLYLYYFDNPSTGLGSALFVLMTFNANVPLFALTEKVHLSLYIADLVLIPLLAVLLLEHLGDESQLTQINRSILFIAAIFVGWTVLAGVFGAGPSMIAGLMFSVEQLRYFLIFLVTVLLVKYNDYRCVIYPVAVALIGHSAFAFTQAYHGSIFGLSTLGEATPRLVGPITIGPIIYQSGLHTGGFIGSSRVLAGALILCVPLLLVFMYELRFSSLFTGLGLSVFGVLVLMSNSDSGWGAFVLTLVIFAAAFYFVGKVHDRIKTTNVPSLALAVVVFNVTLREWSTFTNRLFPPDGSGGSSTEPTASDDVGTPSDNQATNTSTDVVSPTNTNSTHSGSGAEAPANVSRTPEASNALFDASTLGVRLTQYASAIEIGLRYPLFGLGGYNFSLIATTQGLPPMMSIHNIFLAYLAAAGVPGLLLFLGTIGLIIIAIIKHSLHTDRFESLVAIALFSGLTGFLAMAFWTTLNNNTPVMSLMWAVCGIGLGLVERSESVT